MTVLSPDTVLYRAPELVVEIDASNTASVHHHGRVFVFGKDALALLDAFRDGCSLAEALSALAPRLRGSAAFEEAVACVAQLREAGVLMDSPETGFSGLTFPRGGYDAAYVHLRMLGDTARKRAFIAAIEETVRPDDVVLDLGTGSGILAIAAARAGARHVYAVEPSNFIGMAERAARDNGVGDRITFLRGWSTQLDLPERATVLTTDILGNESLDMRLWETVDDARRRLLAHGARLIPAAVTTYACLVSAPAAFLRQYRPDREHVETWRDAYGIDFSCFVEAADRGVLSAYVEPHEAAAWELLSDPVVVYEIDLASPPAAFDVTRTTVAERGGEVNAFLSFFEARLSPSTTLSTAPWSGSRDSHWFCACWAMPCPLRVHADDRVPFRYEYRSDGRSVLSPAPVPDVAEVPVEAS